MSVQVEKLEKNMAKLTVEVAAEELEKAIEAANKKKKLKKKNLNNTIIRTRTKSAFPDSERVKCPAR